MPDPLAEQMLRQGDRLLHKLNPRTWNPKSGEVFPEAFEDQHADLSLFVERMKRPRDVLGFFARFKGLRKAHFGDEKARTPEDLWRVGFGVGVVTYESIKQLNLQFKRYRGGLEIEKTGHVEILNGKNWSLELSVVAIALPENEVFP
jgi:hypothetical protein